MYETPADLAREKVIIEKLASMLMCKAIKIEAIERYFVDHVLMRGNEVHAFAEAKWRAVEYDPYLISLHKWMWLERLAAHAERPSIIVVQWPRRLACVSVLPENCFPVATWGGRTDRGNKKDEEPMIRIPLDRFDTL